MSKRAEEEALKAYPPTQKPSRERYLLRDGYINGYEQAEKEWEQMEDEHGKELLYVCQKTAEREHRSGVRDGKAQVISRIRNQVKLWMPDNPEGDEYIEGKRLAFRSVLVLLDEMEENNG